MKLASKFLKFKNIFNGQKRLYGKIVLTIVDTPLTQQTKILQQELGRLMRRNIMRYMVLAYVITLQRISLRVKRRFPGLQHLVDSGLMLESEKKIFEIMDSKSPMSK